MRRLGRMYLDLRSYDLRPHSKSQLRQDLWVVLETKRKRGGFFVEIGAFDGVQNSNTFLLEKKFGWNGILVEPNPDCLPSLQKNRSAAISTKAAYSKKGQVRFLPVADDPELSSIADHAYDDRLSSRRSDKAEAEIIVETTTLDELLEDHGAPRELDYLSVDTEGSEVEILEGFDFQKYHVSLVSVEHNRHAAREAQLDGIMRRAGFKRVFRRISAFEAWYRNVADAA